jgi:hypothetical protein
VPPPSFDDSAAGSCAVLVGAEKLPSRAEEKRAKVVWSAAATAVDEPVSLTSRRLAETEATLSLDAVAQLRIAVTVAGAGAYWALNWAGVRAA